jgi:uncharacterized repeat protein (TIGR01451 family)
MPEKTSNPSLQFRLPHSLVCSFLFFLLTQLNAQTPDCERIEVSQPGDSYTIEVDPDTFWVRVEPDQLGRDRTQRNSQCLLFPQAGYYRILATAEYSENQFNETFFITVRNASGTSDVSVPVCDPNAGQYKVIRDDIANQIEVIEAEKLVRDAGLFYFEAGRDTIVLNHYFLIQRDHPEFVNPPGALIDPEAAESVHVSQFELIFVQPLIDPVDLRLENIASHDTVKVGQRLSYTLNLSNQSATTAQSIVISDSLPDFFILDELSIAPPPNLINEKILQWDFESLAGFDTISISFSGIVFTEDRVAANLKLENQAFVKSLCDTNYANSGTITSVPIREVEDLADLAIFQTVASDSFNVAGGDTSWYVAAGELYEYTIHVRNISTTPALDVKVFDILPDSIQSPLTQADTLVWSFPALDAGEEAKILVPARLNPTFPDTMVELSNLAWVTTTNEDSTKLANNTSTLNILTYRGAGPVDLKSNIAISQAVMTDSFVVSGQDTSWFVRPGETYDHRITIRNLSFIDAEDIAIAASISGWATFTGSGSRDFAASVNSLPARSDTTLHLQAMLATALPDSAKTFRHLASALAANEDSLLLADNISVLSLFVHSVDDTTMTDSTDVVIYQFAQTDSFVVHNTDTLWYVRPGESFTWNLVAENLTRTDAIDVFIRDIVPDFVTVVSSVSGDTLVWDLGTIAGLSDTTISFVATVDSVLPEGLIEIINFAEIGAANESFSSLANNTSIDTVFSFVEGGNSGQDSVDVTISQSARTSSFEVSGSDTSWLAAPGEVYNYSLTISNLGNKAATGVSVLDALPDNVLAISSQKDSLSWFFPLLAAKSDTTLAFDVQLSPRETENGKRLINRAYVRATNEPLNGLSNNMSVDSIAVRIPVLSPDSTDLTVSQVVRTDSFTVNLNDTTWLVDEGEIVSFTVNVRNLVDVTARNVVLQYLLADSMQITQTQPTIEDTLIWEIGDISGLADTSISFQARLAPSMPVGNNALINRALVRADNELEEKVSNNTSEVLLLNEVPGTSDGYTDPAIEQFVQTGRFEVSGTDTTWFANSGERFTYSLRVANLENEPALGVVVQVTIPDSITVPGQPSIQGRLTWQIGMMPGLADTTFTYEAIMAPRMPVGRNMLPSQAFVEASNELDSTRSNNSAATLVINDVTEIEPVFADLDVRQYVKTDSFVVAGLDTTWYAKAGETYSYIIYLRNNENTPAEHVVLKDLPPDSVAISGNHQFVGDSLFWDLGNLQAYGDTTLILSVTVSQNIRHGQVELINSVLVTADNEDQGKLANNVSVSAGVVYAVPVRAPSESCDAFSLSYNVYEPERFADPLLLSFELEASKEVQIDVYDISGYHIHTISGGFFNTGLNDITWDAVTESGMKVGSGVYLITMRADGISCWKKVIITR